jgi:hypothetical protein
MEASLSPVDGVAGETLAKKRAEIYIVGKIAKIATFLRSGSLGGKIQRIPRVCRMREKQVFV